MRVGFGYDVHQFVAGRKLILGGVHIPFEKGLLGHSDADALCHAIGDALLGSVALGDLGNHFPDDDERFTGISSLLLLKEVGEMVHGKGYQIQNIDSLIVIQNPKLSPYFAAMRKNIAETLSLSESQVSIKATTSEKMGFIGKGKGIAAHACVLIQEREEV
ncbi:MAG: 2-C-methyl-D-erythritol 2,4-cyclodiphosphate synthase [bacterium]